MTGPRVTNSGENPAPSDEQTVEGASAEAEDRIPQAAADDRAVQHDNVSATGSTITANSSASSLNLGQSVLGKKRSHAEVLGLDEEDDDCAEFQARHLQDTAATLFEHGYDLVIKKEPDNTIGIISNVQPVDLDGHMHKKQRTNSADSKRKRGDTSKAKPKKRTTKKSKKVDGRALDKINSNIFQDAEDAGNLQSEPQRDLTAAKGTRRVGIVAQLAGRGRDAARDDKAVLNWAFKQFKSSGGAATWNEETKAWNLKLMNSSIRSHQIIGSGWMMDRERNKFDAQGGLLCDQMGLGKTIQALLLTVGGRNNDQIRLKNERNRDGGNQTGAELEKRRTTLIVCPSNLVKQWHSEVEKHVKIDSSSGRQLKFRILKTSDVTTRELTCANMSKYDIIITIYYEIVKSFPVPDKIPEMLDPLEYEMWIQDHFEKHKGFYHQMKWKRMIVDEVHKMRNKETSNFRACNALTATFRWGLTGTPMVNGPGDLWALFQFVKVRDLESYEDFMTSFGDKVSDEDDLRLDHMCKRFLFRRTHTDELFNARIVTLPKPEFRELGVNLNRVETTIYDVVRKRFIKHMNSMVEEGNAKGRNACAWVLLLRLRQLVAHPYLIQGVMMEMLERDDLECLDEAIQRMGEHTEHGRILMGRIKLMFQQRERENQDKVKGKMVIDLESGEGLTQEEQESLAQIDTSGGWGRSYKAGKLVNSLKTYVNKRNKKNLLLECANCYKLADMPIRTDCDHILCTECNRELQEDAAMSHHNGAACPSCSAIYSIVGPATIETVTTKNPKGRASFLPDNEISWFEAGGEIVPSAKTIAVKAQIHEWQTEFPQDKILVYTLWRDMIKILENMCKKERWTFCKYTGNMSQKSRDNVLSAFSQPDGPTIMLMGLQCGSLGLNLTAANRVICVDSWFNNAVEQQAFARTWRIGQTKETSLLRISARNTVDERLEQIKERKQVRIDQLHRGDHGEPSKLTQYELLSCFGRVEKDVNGEDIIVVDDD